MQAVKRKVKNRLKRRNKNAGMTQVGTDFLASAGEGTDPRPIEFKNASSSFASQARRRNSQKRADPFPTRGK